MLLVLLLFAAGNLCLGLTDEEERLINRLLNSRENSNREAQRSDFGLKSLDKMYNRHTENRLMDNRLLENRHTDNRHTDNRLLENRFMDNRLMDSRHKDSRVLSERTEGLLKNALRDPTKRAMMQLLLNAEITAQLSDQAILKIAITLGIVGPIGNIGDDGSDESDKSDEGTSNEEYDMFSDESSARRFLAEYNSEGSRVAHDSALAEYIKNSNMSDYNTKQAEAAGETLNRFSLKATEIGKKYYENRDKFEDESLVRQLSFISSSTMLADPQKRKRLTTILSEMSNAYSSNRFCLNKKCYLVEPDAVEIFKSSRDPKHLLWAWEESRRVMLPLKEPFFEAVDLGNEGARDNGFKDLSEAWKADEEIDDIEKVCEEIFQEFKPLYIQLHAYVRRKLNEYYKDDGVDIGENEAIPAHLLGNVWAQQWHNIIDIVQPFPEVPLIDATEQLKEQGYTPLSMFKEAERFYQSIGLPAMTKSFWNMSIIEQNKEVNMSCHGSAHDFSNGKDYAIMMCTAVDQYDFYVVHHEMGHVQYYMAYSSQPLPFRGGANSGFHEAIGDSIALSVMSETHLRSLGLIKDDPQRLNDIEKDEELSYAEKQNLNMLMRMALEKIPVIPWAYTVDKWRWAVFRGDVTADNSNEYWWKLRAEYSGLKAPLQRKADGFDLGSKYHVPNFVPYIRYFIAHLISFTFHESMCEWAGQRDAVNYCDIFGSKEAGSKLEEMMKLGKSKHWEEAMSVLTGDRKFGASSITRYFKPLTTWLKKQNKGHEVGWDVDDAMRMIKSE